MKLLYLFDHISYSSRPRSYNKIYIEFLQILKIVDRIENFEITSPISRFLTGFELVLSKCNEWSQFARKSENLSNNIETITRWIIDMRKFELQHWGNSLNNILQK